MIVGTACSTGHDIGGYPQLCSDKRTLRRHDLSLHSSAQLTLEMSYGSASDSGSQDSFVTKSMLSAVDTKAHPEIYLLHRH